MNEAFDTEDESMPVEFERDSYLTDDGTVWEFTVKVGGMPRVPDDFSLALGECLHNYRGVLDHTAWWLARRSTKTNLSTESQRAIQFPMARTRAKYWGGHARNRLPHVHRDFLTLFERYQPYRRSIEGRAIRFLRDLTNIDKHRSIIVMLNYAGEGTFNFDFAGGRAIDQTSQLFVGEQIKRGTKIATLTLLADSQAQPEVRVKGSVQFTLAFPNTMLRPVAGHPVIVRRALADIARICEEVVSEVEAHF